MRPKDFADYSTEPADVLVAVVVVHVRIVILVIVVMVRLVVCVVFLVVIMRVRVIVLFVRVVVAHAVLRLARWWLAPPTRWSAWSSACRASASMWSFSST